MIWGEKEGRANNRGVCACVLVFFFPNVSSYILVSHSILDAHYKLCVYFLKGFEVFSGESSKE